jgi:two-component system, NtrC family, nitrogen regulation sensor histidine kinase NtrY
MASYLEAERQDLRRRRRERYIIAGLMVMVVVLTTLGFRVLNIGIDLPLSHSILVFGLINLNIILLLLLLFLIVRNLVKLLFEHRSRMLGAKLRLKLVLAFILLSLLPTVLLFFVSVQFISISIEYWTKIPVERSLKTSLEVGQSHYDKKAEELFGFGNNLSRLMTYHGYMLVSKQDALEKFISDKRREYGLASIQVFGRSLDVRGLARDRGIDLSPFKPPGESLLEKALNEGAEFQDRQFSPHGHLVTCIVPVFSRTESKAVVGLVTLSEFIPGAFVNRLEAISRGLEEYKQFKVLKRPVKISHLITLSIVTLLIIFSSIWFGFYLSKGITVPIQELAEGTRRIAAGDYDVFIDLESRDEIGGLVHSFNSMAMDLKNGKIQLEKANEELIRSNIEIERRRLYMEIVLANVAAGVVSASADGRIQTINKSAERMLQLNRRDVIGRHYRDFIGEEYVNLIDGLFKDGTLFRKGFIERQIRLPVGNRTLTLLVHLNVLLDDKGDYVGLVGVFEDLTEIEKAQRMAAWREVARRIAHEVKNPLTPIQLSAQRLRKKYGKKLVQEDGKVFEECTKMIISQVEALKGLVNEFSSFARMPTLDSRPERISEIILEAVRLYKEAETDIKITYNEPKDVPMVKVDREQMKRVMINLLDNAIAAVGGKGEIKIDIDHDVNAGLVRISVEDNGKGISPDLKAHIFEPYFSTKKHGTGLGLAIVNTIVSDHHGSVRVEDNFPSGSRFVVELPVAA